MLKNEDVLSAQKRDVSKLKKRKVYELFRAIGECTEIGDRKENRR